MREGYPSREGATQIPTETLSVSVSLSFCQRRLSQKFKNIYALEIGAFLKLNGCGFCIQKGIDSIEVATNAATPIVVPLTCAVLFLLFLSQHWGTAGIGKILGRVMTLSFVSIAALGLGQIFQDPRQRISGYPQIELWSLALRSSFSSGSKGEQWLGQTR